MLKPSAFRSWIVPAVIGVMISFMIEAGRYYFGGQIIGAFQLRLDIAFYAIIGMMLVDAAALDIQKQEVDSARVLYICALVIGYQIGMTLLLASAQITSTIWSIALGASIGGGLPYLLVKITSGRGMGDGDPFLGALMGILVGFPGALIGWFLAITLGVICGIGFMLAGKLRRGQPMPFGPYILGVIPIVMVYGNSIWGWYMHFAK